MKLLLLTTYRTFPPKISFVVTVIFIISGLSAFARLNESDHAAFTSDDEKLRLVDEMAEAWAGVNSWRIEYEVAPFGVTKGFVKTHQIMAVAAPGEIYHLGAHSTPQYPWQKDPYSQELFIYQRRTCH